MFLAVFISLAIFLFWFWNLALPEIANFLLDLVISTKRRVINSVRERRPDPTWVKEGAHIF